MQRSLGFKISSLYLAIFIGTSALADSYRDLTSAEGRSVRARVLKYDRSSDMALIEREDHKSYPVSPDDFCEADKLMIRNWELVEGFMSDSGLRVSIDRLEKKLEEREEQRGEDTTVYIWLPEVHFNISLKNLTDSVFRGIKVEVVPFVNNEVLLPHRDKDHKFKGESAIQTFYHGDIEVNSSIEFSTKKVGGAECYIVTERSEVISKDLMNDFQGVWVRITMVLPGGNQVMREIKYPDNLWTGIDWADATQIVDLKTMNSYTNALDYINASGFGKL